MTDNLLKFVLRRPDPQNPSIPQEWSLGIEGSEALALAFVQALSDTKPEDRKAMIKDMVLDILKSRGEVDLGDVPATEIDDMDEEAELDDITVAIPEQMAAEPPKAESITKQDEKTPAQVAAERALALVRATELMAMMSNEDRHVIRARIGDATNERGKQLDKSIRKMTGAELRLMLGEELDTFVQRMDEKQFIGLMEKRLTDHYMNMLPNESGDQPPSAKP